MHNCNTWITQRCSIHSKGAPCFLTRASAFAGFTGHAAIFPALSALWNAASRKDSTTCEPVVPVLAGPRDSGQRPGTSAAGRSGRASGEVLSAGAVAKSKPANARVQLEGVQPHLGDVALSPLAGPGMPNQCLALTSRRISSSPPSSSLAPFS